MVVLSKNDGCVVARSNEAKRMGIKAGTPFFQLAEQFPDQKTAVFSSNYELYGDITARVMCIIEQESPRYFRYSIDEAFVDFRPIEASSGNGALEPIDYKAWANGSTSGFVASWACP